MRFVRMACTTQTIRSAMSTMPMEPKPNISFSRRGRAHSVSCGDIAMRTLCLLLEFAARAFLPVGHFVSGFSGRLPGISDASERITIAAVEEKHDARQYAD